MTSIFDQARDIINGAVAHPDPEGAMKALERRASPEEKAMFPSLWEALVVQLNAGSAGQE